MTKNTPQQQPQTGVCKNSKPNEKLKALIGLSALFTFMGGLIAATIYLSPIPEEIAQSNQDKRDVITDCNEKAKASTDDILEYESAFDECFEKVYPPNPSRTPFLR